MTGNNKLAVLLAVALTTLLAVVFAGAVRAETFAEGDQVMVKVLAIEGNKIRLSRKALIKEQRDKQQKDTGTTTTTQE